MADVTDIERNLCFGHVSELTFTLTTQAIEYFEQKLHDAPPEHKDVYEYVFGRIEHVRGTMQTECSIRRETFLRQQRHENADIGIAVEAWNFLCWEFVR